MRRVRIGADDQHARPRVALGHQRVRDALRSFAFGTAAVVHQPVLRREGAVRRGEPPHARDQSLAHVQRTALRVAQVVLEADDARRVVQPVAGAEAALQQVRAHAGVVLVDEAQVRGDEAGRGAVALHDLLEERHGPRAAGGRGGGFGRRRGAGAVAQQPAGAHDGRRLRLAPGEDLVDGDRLAALQPRQQAEVRAGQKAEVVGVLPVDALEALREHDAHARRQLGQRGVFARAALAVAPAPDEHGDPGVAQRVARDRPLAAGGESGERVPAERGVEVHHRRKRRDLVGGDVVAQRAGLGQRQRAPGELRPHERGDAAQVEPAALRQDVHAIVTAPRCPPSSPAARTSPFRCGRTASPCRPVRR